MWRYGSLNPPPDDTQAGKVRLFIGAAGTLFDSADYDIYNVSFNTNLLYPPEVPLWTESEWDTALTGNAVVPIRYQVSPNSWSMEYVLDKDSTYTPDDGAVRWLRFVLEPHRLPSTDVSGALPFSFVAYVYDPEACDGGDVTTNLAMAERRFNVVEAARSFVPIPQIMLLLFQ